MEEPTEIGVDDVNRRDRACVTSEFFNRWYRNRKWQTESSGKVARDTSHRHCIGTIGVDFEIEQNVWSDAKRFDNRRSQCKGRIENVNTGMVFTESEFPSRAQHSVRPFTAHFTTSDLHAVRHCCAERGQRNNVANREVGGAATNLQSLAIAKIDVDKLNLVGIGVLAKFKNLDRDNAIETFADALDGFNGHTEIAHDVAESDGIIAREWSELLQPRQKYLHDGNCSKNRTSPVYISRMSSTP
ncbi:unannotated protein [freshwater metagenome]|uniref:Unannotated protein n=1 Tax=freshwater metagenome TaxID=449393 RepID=A0A6J6Y8P0_9ZZZZ